MDLVEVLERRGELGQHGGRVGQIHPALIVAPKRVDGALGQELGVTVGRAPHSSVRPVGGSTLQGINVRPRQAERFAHGPHSPSPGNKGERAIHFYSVAYSTASSKVSFSKVFLSGRAATWRSRRVRPPARRPERPPRQPAPRSEHFDARACATGTVSSQRRPRSWPRASRPRRARRFASARVSLCLVVFAALLKSAKISDGADWSFGGQLNTSGP